MSSRSDDLSASRPPLPLEADVPLHPVDVGLGSLDHFSGFTSWPLPLRPKKRTSRQSLAPAMHQRQVQATQRGRVADREGLLPVSRSSRRTAHRFLYFFPQRDTFLLSM